LLVKYLLDWSGLIHTFFYKMHHPISPQNEKKYLFGPAVGSSGQPSGTGLPDPL
jgi:hypothetical protein